MNTRSRYIRLAGPLLALAALVRPAFAGIAQQAYLKASNSEGADLFSRSVAISVDTVVVGAPGESSDATGVNGNQSNNDALHAGAAYVFVRSGTNWSQQAYLKASNPGAGDWFGNSVAISGDTVVIGAWYEDSNAAGVNGDQVNNTAIHSGAAYVFVRTGTNWSQQAYLKASKNGEYDNFGFSVAISGETVIVGAPYESSNATGVNGTQTDANATNSGAAYVFVRNGTTWMQQAYLKPSNAETGGQFGNSVAISGDTVVVGAWNEGSSASGVNGDQNDNSASSSGAAYVFARNGTNWSQQAYLKASNPDADDWFGSSVAVSDDTAVVGAWNEGSSASGVNGDQNDNSTPSAGAAYVFVRSSTNWSQQAYLKASNPDANDWFGQSVAVSGGTVVVGAYGEASNATGVDGDQSDNSAPRDGAAYVFVRSGTNWSQKAYLKASNTGMNNYFAGSLSVSGDTVAAAEAGDASNAGAAYIFTGLGNVLPQLTLIRSAGDVILTWPTNATGFVLQSATTLANGGDWQDSSLAPTIVGDQNSVTVPPTGSSGFFRLHKP